MSSFPLKWNLENSSAFLGEGQLQRCETESHRCPRESGRDKEGAWPGCKRGLELVSKPMGAPFLPIHHLWEVCSASLVLGEKIHTIICS